MACCSSLLRSGMAEDRIILGDVSRPFGLSSFVLRHFFLLGVGLGLSIKYSGVAKFLPHIYIYIYPPSLFISVILDSNGIRKK